MNLVTTPGLWHSLAETEKQTPDDPDEKLSYWLAQATNCQIATNQAMRVRMVSTSGSVPTLLGRQATACIQRDRPWAPEGSYLRSLAFGGKVTCTAGGIWFILRFLSVRVVVIVPASSIRFNASW